MKKNKLVLTREMGNFREVLENSTTQFKDHVAYIYKENAEVKPVKYIEKTYEQVGKDVRAFSTALLNHDLSGKRIAVIGSNRYEWIIGYLSTVCGGMIIAPMDRLLQENEISSLIQRSEVEAVIFDSQYLDTFKKLQADKNYNLKTLICMDSIDDKNVINFANLLNEGNELIAKGDTSFDKVKIDDNAMSIMLFTSGTTSKSKIVMLSQKNICSNMYGYQTHFKMLPSDTLLSFLPIHHTFESSITILYGFYCGVTVAFCDGLRYIAANLK